MPTSRQNIDSDSAKNDHFLLQRVVETESRREIMRSKETNEKLEKTDENDESQPERLTDRRTEKTSCALQFIESQRVNRQEENDNWMRFKNTTPMKINKERTNTN